MKGRSIPYSDAELAWIEQRHTWPRPQLHAEFCETFGRADVRLVNLNSLCKRNGWMTGRTGRYEAGQEPHNKGKPFSPPGSERGRFKKGNRPHNTRFLGHERVSKDGYAEVSIAETNPHTGFDRRYVLKHRHLWEQANGRLPKGMCLKCLDGNKLNTDPSNWEAVPRALLPRLNGRFGRNYDGASPEIKPLILAVAKLEHGARTARRGRKSA